MNKTFVNKTPKGFRVEASEEQKKRQDREERVKAGKSNKNPTMKDVFALLNDIADRQSEIYDMLKEQRR